LTSGAAVYRSLVRNADAVSDYPALKRRAANFWWLLAITVLFGWMTLVGVVRAEFLRTRNYDYIRAAQALASAIAPLFCAICCLTPWSPP
jgi:ABC-type dipeptide/oligopeptide/nickel transport system permease subunit